jgi:hypothetical protein
MNSKAVSETLGYILILGMVIVAISYVYANTYDILEDTSSKFRVEGLRQSFKRIQNVLSISIYGAPLQSIQVETQGGTFWIGNETQIKIAANSSIAFDGYVNSLKYKYEDLEVALENGAVWEDYYGYKKMVSAPRIFIHTTSTQDASQATKTVAIIILNKLKGSFSVSGKGSLKLIFNTTLVNVTTYSMSGNLTINLTSPYAKLWYEFFKTLPGNSQLSGNKASFSSYYDKLIITEYEVGVEARQLSFD